MEVPKLTPVAALYLELGILPVKYEIEIKQLSFLKRILDKEADDPVLLSFQEMLKFGSEANWAKNRELMQTDVAAERRRSHSNLHSIKSDSCQGPSEFTWLLSPFE